jgi:hypothetical protein
MSSIQTRAVYALTKKFTINRLKAKAFISCLPESCTQDENPEYTSLSKSLMDREYRKLSEDTGLPVQYLRAFSKMK